MNDTATSIECVSSTCLFPELRPWNVSLSLDRLYASDSNQRQNRGAKWQHLVVDTRKLYTEGKAREGELTAHAVASASYAKPEEPRIGLTRDLR